MSLFPRQSVGYERNQLQMQELLTLTDFTVTCR